MRIAIVFEGDIYKQRGEFIAIRNRIKTLQKYHELNVDIFVIRLFVGNIIDRFLKFNSGERCDEIYFDGIKYRCIWVRKSFVDFFMKKLFKRGTNIEFNRLKKRLKLSKYDLIFAHSLQAGLLALENGDKYRIPYIMMWHGSSIHTTPFNDRNSYNNTRKVLSNANYNLFVSNELQQIANSISFNVGGITLNGVDVNVYKSYSIEEKNSLRVKYNLPSDCINVAFIGNCYPIKNVNFLPRLFSAINGEYPNTHFFLIGSGEFNELFTDSGIHYTCINNVQNADMPDIYNLMDLVVLPSINEGLPMTCLEASACGVAFVASRVGGIAEVVGDEMTVPWTDSFERDFIELCCATLKTKKPVAKLPSRYMLDTIVEYEYTLMRDIIMNNSTINEKHSSNN